MFAKQIEKLYWKTKIDFNGKDVHNLTAEDIENRKLYIMTTDNKIIAEVDDSTIMNDIVIQHNEALNKLLETIHKYSRKNKNN